MTIKAIIFDMGGVIVELGPLSDIVGDLPIEPEDFWPRWIASETVRAFEMGRSDEAAFVAGLSAEFGIDGERFRANFASWPKGLYPGAAQLVADLKADFIVGCLSNTNALHWGSQVDAADVRSLFDPAFISFEMGLVKPDREIFDAVLAGLDLPGSDVLFLDDNQVNVDAAIDAGFVARRVLGPVEARAAIENVLDRRI